MIRDTGLTMRSRGL